ncbi:hypothetical protein FOZ60_005079 [Perkinsus olseni]|uniref:Uncharacterized protein n=1 Tax=Perkinsus olseni TaxID=32597 RepID=A0A7J6NSF0_PEROL|nr:hypothetical protein FOZ60_005079 [Perkinsus olseni]
MAIRRRESSPTLTTTDDDDCNATPWAKRRRKAATITSPPPSIALLQHHQLMRGKVSDNTSDDDDTRCDDTHVIVSTTTTSDEGSSRESNDGMHHDLGEERYSDTMVIAAKTAEGQHTSSSSRRYSIVLPSIHDDPHEECVVEAEVILPHHHHHHHHPVLLLPQYPDHCPSEQLGQHRVEYIDNQEVTTQVDIDHAGDDGHDDGHDDGYEYHGDGDEDDDTPPLVVNLHLVAHPHQKYEIRISPSGEVEYTIQPRPLMSELKDVMSTIVAKLRSILIPNRVCEKAEHDADDNDVDEKASSSLMIAGDGHEGLPAAILDSHHHLPVGMPIALESFHNIPALPPSSSSTPSPLPLPPPFTRDSSSEGSSSVDDDVDNLWTMMVVVLAFVVLWIHLPLSADSKWKRRREVSSYSAIGPLVTPSSSSDDGVLRWLLLLVAGYAYNRFFCEKYNIPRDSDRYTYLGHSTNLANLAMFGIIQAWFVEVIDDPKRSKWIFSFPRWWFFITFFAASTVFTLLGMLDALSHNSISPSGHLDRWNAFSTVLTVLASLLLLLILWHVWYSIKVLPTYPDAAVYILSRFGVVCTFGVTFLLIHFDDEHNHDDNPVTFHLHHYFIAWLLSLIAAFDHPISLIMLAITSGIFVQGIAAYSAAGIFFRPRNDNGSIDDTNFLF